MGSEINNPWSRGSYIFRHMGVRSEFSFHKKYVLASPEVDGWGGGGASRPPYSYTHTFSVSGRGVWVHLVGGEGRIFFSVSYCWVGNK